MQPVDNYEIEPFKKPYGNMMLYELSADGQTVGVFPTEAAARHNAAYMPDGCYTIREWTKDGEFLIFDPLVNLEREINK